MSPETPAPTRTHHSPNNSPYLPKHLHPPHALLLHLESLVNPIPPLAPPPIAPQVPPSVPLEGFKAAVYGALQSGGLAGVCPLGLLAGSWAVTGAVVREGGGWGCTIFQLQSTDRDERIWTQSPCKG